MTIFKNPIHNGDLNFVHKSYAHHQQMALFLCLLRKAPDRVKGKESYFKFYLKKEWASFFTGKSFKNMECP